MKKHFWIVIVLTVMLGGCIVGETSHRIYIEPGGLVQWVVLETELRSNADTPERRANEEARLVESVVVDDHPVRRAFELLGAQDSRSELLRDRRPYAVWTEARFRSVEEVVREALYWLGIRGEVSFTTIDGISRLQVWLPPDQDDEVVDESVLNLVADLEDYRIVLTEGRFVEAMGFELEEEGRVAVPKAPIEQDDDRAAAPLVLVLAWTVVEPGS